MPSPSPTGRSGNIPSRPLWSPLLARRGCHCTGRVSEGSRQQGLRRKGCALGARGQGQAAQGLCTGSGALSRGKEPTVSPRGVTACPASVPLP